MTEHAQTAHNGLKLARNILAGAGATLLLIGLVFHAADGPASIPIWIGLVSLAAATGLALTARPMSTGTRVITVVAVVAASIVVIDLIN